MVRSEAVARRQESAESATYVPLAIDGEILASTTPPPIPLLPGEQVIRHIDFTPRLILTYLKTTMILTNRRVVVSSPNTLFGFIPHGYSVHAAPLETVTDVACGNGRETGLAGRFLLTVVPLLVVLFALFYLLMGMRAF